MSFIPPTIFYILVTIIFEMRLAFRIRVWDGDELVMSSYDFFYGTCMIMMSGVQKGRRLLSLPGERERKKHRAHGRVLMVLRVVTVFGVSMMMIVFIDCPYFFFVFSFLAAWITSGRRADGAKPDRVPIDRIPAVQLMDSSAQNASLEPNNNFFENKKVHLILL